ncbi:Cold shock domain-containing protein E1 [Anopheles sinensis]|uniref:Cold shock domain-containing protein E1 n=1 Tax=Anopheles sinensis TaxID=74873 RepID=A0A084W7R5_ANOSI|nr:Cold shock domain-containing protein E1 [Anopheles sinensis]
MTVGSLPTRPFLFPPQAPRRPLITRIESLWAGNQFLGLAFVLTRPLNHLVVIQSAPTSWSIPSISQDGPAPGGLGGDFFDSTQRPPNPRRGGNVNYNISLALIASQFWREDFCRALQSIKAFG